MHSEPEPKFAIGDEVVFTLGRDERQDKHKRSKPAQFSGVISRIHEPNKIGRIYEIQIPDRSRNNTFAKYEHDIRLKEES